MAKSTHEHSYHVKGQKDASKGNYNVPHGIGTELTTFSSERAQRHIDENRAYREGHAGTKGQIDSARNKYEPPSNKDAREAYTKAWKDSRNNSR